MIKGLCKTYSRCGKTCDERFNNIKEDRALMLLGEQPRSSISSAQLIHRKNFGVLKDVITEINSHRDRIKTARADHLSPVFLAQGRDEYYVSTTNRDKVPPCGYYNIQNQGLKKCKSIPNFSKKHRSKPKTEEKSRSNSPREKDKTHKSHTKGFLFQRQLPRPDVSTFAPFVSDERFESVKEYPKIFSKTRNIVAPCFDNGTGHDLALPETKNSRIYNPKVDFVKTSTSNVALDFDKFTARKPNINQIADIDYNRKSYKQTDKSVPTVDFDKKTSRPQGNLPSFMVRTTSRCGLGQITDKTLAHNHFSESQYFDKGSAFKSKKYEQPATQSVFQVTKSNFGKSLY